METENVINPLRVYIYRYSCACQRKPDCEDVFGTLGVRGRASRVLKGPKIAIKADYQGVISLAIYKCHSI